MAETGYLSKAYADSFKEFGQIVPLGKDYRYLLERPIDSTEYKDLVSLYPLYCAPPEHTFRYLENTSTPHITTTLITSPLIDPYPYFQERDLVIVKPYKTHYIVNLTKQYHCSHYHWNKVHEFAESGHEVNIRILYPHNVIDYAQHFYKLYKVLCKKRKIEGLIAFSELAMIRQFQTPGLIVFEVLDTVRNLNKDSPSYNPNPSGLPMAIRTFMIQGNDIYYHLAAQTYKCIKVAPGFSQAVHYAAIMYAKQLGLENMVLGGVPDGAESSGLKDFKEGFATHTRQNHICMKIHNPKVYEQLKPFPMSPFLPAYRG